MKINIAIPCFNEEINIKKCIDDIKSLGEKFYITVINDGSTDSTLDILSNEDGIKILTSNVNFGLAEVFNSIIHNAIEEKYDYIVVFDADNQYPHEEILKLIKFTSENNHDIALGCRQFNNNNVFTKTKNIIQIIGSKVVSFFAGVDIQDVTTGFRCYSSSAFEDLYIMNKFSYTIESLFIAKKNNFKIGTYELQSFNKTRKSRLFKNNREYIMKTIKILVSSIMLYRKKLIVKLYLLSIFPGLILCSRFLFNYFTFDGYDGNVQSLIVGTGLLTISTIFFTTILNFSYSKSNFREVLIFNFRPKHKAST